MKTLTYNIIQQSNLKPTSLHHFNRHQETTHVLVKENDNCYVKRDCFIDEWDDEKKVSVIESLQHCIECGGRVVGTYDGDKLVGFASVEWMFFGSNLEYIELPFIHVSYEYRHQGIGKKLFSMCCVEAKRLGATKLYIGAHPSEETQKFYRTVGCTFAEEINEEIFRREPLDLQLEKRL